MASPNGAQTDKILRRHWQAFKAGDVDAIMADYAENAVLITPESTLKGQMEIRSLFEGIFANMFPPDKTEISLTRQIVEGEIAYILWSGSSPQYNAPLGTDNFVVRKGKIIAQTFAARLEAK